MGEGNGDETEVFYLKMCGDYYRYLSEFRTESEEYKNSAEQFYKKAMDVAEANLNETHPTRLGSALNFSVCYYEILKKPGKACELAKKSFDAAIEKLDTLNDASYKDSTLIMQLLRDNLTLWTSSNEEDGDADAQYREQVYVDVGWDLGVLRVGCCTGGTPICLCLLCFQYLFCQSSFTLNH